MEELKEKKVRTPKVEKAVDKAVQEVAEAPIVIEKREEIAEIPAIEKNNAKPAKVEPVISNSQSRKPQPGEAYISRLNKSLGIMISKYAVRLCTSDGYREVARYARGKAYIAANNLNKSHGLDIPVYIED